MPVNSILMQQVKQALASKRAFVASGPGGAPPADPAAAGGAPPMDPAAMGGMPPPGAGAPPMDPAAMGGMPPMDPAAMGGMPPMDPAAMGGAPPPPPPPAAPAHDPNMIRQLIQEEIQKSMAGGGAGGEGKPKGKGAGKVDPAQMLEYMERQQKLLVNLYESLGLSLPYDILDKPADPEAEDGQTPAKEQPTSSDISGIPPIQPIKPIGGKQASVGDKAQAMRYMLNAMRRNG